jgi:YqaJ-like recombinase protein
MPPKLEFFDCDQGTPEWFQARCGVVTASTFSDVLAKGEGKSRTKLLYSIAAEILSGKPTPSWGSNVHTERGHEMEGEVRSLYEAFLDHEIAQVGFMRLGRIGCSPDSLVGGNGLLEIKTRLPHLQIEVLERGTLPPENRAQVQGQLLVSGREWCDYRSYWPGLPQLKLRVHRDETYLKTLQDELDRFHTDVDRIVQKYR